MITIAVIWCLIGFLFGIPRSKARYFDALEERKSYKSVLGWWDYFEIWVITLFEQAKWTILGVLSGISYIAWFLLELAIANKKELEKPSNLGAIGFSILVFILGAIALEKANEEKITRRRKAHNK
ncbi:MAG: hypothetical protein O2845_03855 [Proteobacteria bacterium]|nr:hypothetical protein [Pseudomonadota bacterium]